MDYVYNVLNVVRVLDGDTFWLSLSKDIGFYMSANPTVEIRLFGFDCPESSPRAADRPAGYDLSYERQQAVIAKEFTINYFARNAGYLTCTTQRDPDSFGRWLGIVKSGSLLSLGESLNQSGYASVWPRRWWEDYGK